ncbi:MAG: hypothetical protein QXG38_03225 [Candidatus Hadarchaeales archaeon]
MKKRLAEKMMKILSSERRHLETVKNLTWLTHNIEKRGSKLFEGQNARKSFSQ